MYYDFLGPADQSIDELDILYDAAQDPFVDLPEDELVEYLHLS